MRSFPARLLASLLFALAAAAPARAEELVVSAAASLGDAFREIATAFEAAHPGTRIRLNLAASGTLLQQIARGAPVDVFAAADLATMDQAQARGLIAVAQRRTFATNTLVLIVPPGSATRPASLGDLALPTYRRVAIGNPASVPVGRYARIALEGAGLWDTIHGKLVHAQSVRQALDYVARAEVDAGFVYATDAAIMKDKVEFALTVPLPQPVSYPIAPVAASAHPGMARAFVDWVVGAPGQALLARYGFTRP